MFRTDKYVMLNLILSFSSLLCTFIPFHSIPQKMNGVNQHLHNNFMYVLMFRHVSCKSDFTLK